MGDPRYHSNRRLAAPFLPGTEPRPLSTAELKQIVKARLTGLEWRQKAREAKREMRYARDRRRRRARAASGAS